MTEYGEFRLWAQQTTGRLAAEAGQPRLLEFLEELRDLNGELLEVCDAISELSHGSTWDLLRKLRRFARLAPDPLRHVRAGMRRVRGRYGNGGN